MPLVPRVRQLLWLALPLVALLGCAHVEPGREVLQSLRVEGNETLSTSEIEARLALSETPVWPWADPRYFDAGTLSGDRRRLVRYYQANGFYDARVKSRLRREANKVYVTLVVEEGAPSVVERLEISGLEALPASVRRAVEAQPLPLRENQRISEEAWDALQALLAERLREQGYGDAQVRGAVEVDADRRIARARVEVEPGPRLTFGRVVITGAVDVPRDTILRAVRQAIPANGRYSDSRLAEAEANVVAMGVFGGVRVSRGPTHPDEATVPVMVAVREAPFQTVRAGVGFGVDGRRISTRATGEYTHRNFLGGLRTLRFENQVGYALLYEELDRLDQLVDHGVVGSSALDFTQPNLLRRVDANLRLEYAHDLELAYSFDAVKGRLGFPIRLHRSLTFTPSYHVQRFWLHDRAAVATADAGGNCQLERADCVLAFLEERLTWDRRDHPVETRSGWYGSVSVQQGRTWLGSQSSYDRVLGEVRWFHPLPWRTVLALRLEGGALFPHEDERSPIMERFYAGGGTSVRAFNADRLSPQAMRNRQPVAAGTTVSARDTVPIGGDALLEGSAELRVPLAGDLGMALFVDAGNVSRYANSDGFAELLRPNVGVGAGLRYRTPFGPVRFDVGWLAVRNLPCIGGDGTCEARVNESPFALHFSIGEAF